MATLPASPPAGHAADQGSQSRHNHGRAATAGTTAAAPNLFYSVYLLMGNGGRRTYVGFTTNPRRRLRQHKGELVGGAKRTKGRDWSMMLLVHGFPNAVAALRFEWQLQHPESARPLRVARSSAALLLPKSRAAQGTLLVKLRALAHLLRVPPWCRMGLTLHWLQPEARVRFDSLGLPPPAHVLIAEGDLETPAFRALTRLLFRHEHGHNLDNVALDTLSGADAKAEGSSDNGTDDCADSDTAEDDEASDDGIDAEEGDDDTEADAHVYNSDNDNDSTGDDTGCEHGASQRPGAVLHMNSNARVNPSQPRCTAALPAPAASLADGAVASAWGTDLCSLCHQGSECGVDTAAPVECWTPTCAMLAHSSCLARHLLGSADGRYLFPVAGSCPACGTALRWGDVVRRQRLRACGIRVVSRGQTVSHDQGWGLG